jgi:uncharacterized protein (TIGR00251 family)
LLRCPKAERTRLVSVATAPNETMSVIRIKVKPGSRESKLDELNDGSFFATLKSPPIDGKANAELIAVVAKHFKVSKSAVTIKSGAGARIKLVTIAQP